MQRCKPHASIPDSDATLQTPFLDPTDSDATLQTPFLDPTDSDSTLQTPFLDPTDSDATLQTPFLDPTDSDATLNLNSLCLFVCLFGGVSKAGEIRTLPKTWLELVELMC
jgi:hypothetical protein